MKHLGDYDAGGVLYGKFTNYSASTGVPATLTGGTLAVYKDNSTTESTAGVSLSADFDGRTGLNHYAIDTSADATFYAAGGMFDIVLTAGTVSGVSVVGGVVASFTLRRSAIGSRAGNLDAAVSTRLATSGYTAPDNASVSAIKAQTDKLAFTVANQIDANIKSVAGTTINGSGTAGSPWGP